MKLQLQSALLVALAAALTACGATPAAPAPTTAPPATAVATPAPTSPPPTVAPATAAPTAAAVADSILADCPPASGGITAFTFPGPDDETLRGVVLGSGPNGVVLSNQNNNNPCPWLSFAQDLVGQGYRVLLYRYGASENDAYVSAAVAALKQQGAERIALVGASQGASSSLVTAGEPPAGVTAAVVLSPGIISAGREIARFADTTTIPILYATADADTPSATVVPQYYKQTPATAKQLIVVPGKAHGYELLDDAKVREQVLAFLAAHR